LKNQFAKALVFKDCDIDLDKDIRRLALDGDDPNCSGSDRVFKIP
jgi:hypothetical protein